MTAIFLQMLQYFMLLDWLSKYVQLIYKGIYDALGFLSIFGLFLLFFTLGFHVLGAGMDDGDNYTALKTKSPGDASGYNAWHNDYPHTSYIFVCLLSALRTSVGDLSTPGFTYW